MSSEINVSGSSPENQPNQDDESVAENRDGLDRATPEDRDDYIDPDTMPELEPESPERQKASNAEKFTAIQASWTYPGRRW